MSLNDTRPIRAGDYGGKERTHAYGIHIKLTEGEHTHARQDFDLINQADPASKLAWFDKWAARIVGSWGW